MEKEKNKPAPPQMSPYVFTVLLMGFGLWCFWDGWLTTDPEMLKHATFNRVLSGILLSWGIYDFFKLRKRQRNNKQSED
jgi:hypothetical protein